jgi:Na+/H+-dicarboxylate symporter
VFAAIIAGQVAGLAMVGALALLFGYADARHGLSFPFQIIAAVFAGDEALQEPAAIGHLFCGAVTHLLGPSLFWSLVFGVAAPRLRARKRLGAALVLGLLVAGAALVIDVFVVVPRVATYFAGHDVWRENVPASWSAMAHAVYGLALGWIFVEVRGRMARKPFLQRPL